MNFNQIKLPSNRKFGFFFTTVFLIASFYSYYVNSELIFYTLSTIGGIFLIVTIINADTLLPLNKLWMKFGILLGMIISPIIMGIIFFGIFTPIAILMRLTGRDELRLRFIRKKSHWTHRKKTKEFDTFKKQF